MKFVKGAMMSAFALLASGAAHADFKLFGSITPVTGTAANVYYNAATRSIYTISSASAVTPGSVPIRFTFKQDTTGNKAATDVLKALNYTLNNAVDNPVSFTLFATSDQGVTSTSGGRGRYTYNQEGFDTLDQNINTASGFSLKTTRAIEVGGYDCDSTVALGAYSATHCFATASAPNGTPTGTNTPKAGGGYHHTGMVYAAGLNLLSATFTDAGLSGLRTGGSTGSFQDSTGFVGQEFYDFNGVVYKSDVLDFNVPGSSSVERDFSLAISSIPNPGTSGTQNSLASFRGVISGTTTSNPLPRVTAVPEAQTWGMMVVGFSLVGGALRSSRRKKIVAAA